MLLMQDRVLGETMMQLVPSSSSHPLSTLDSVSQLEFDLDLLPSLTDCVVPGSPTYHSLYSLDLPVSPTMFSPDSKSAKSPGSPYSPAFRGERKVSTQSNNSLGLHDSADLSSINLQESLAEFTQLQDRIKQENENLFDSNSSALSLDSSMSIAGSFPERFSMSRDSNLVFPLSPDSTQSQDVKMEPLEFLERPVLTPPQGDNNPLLKQCLSDTSFQTRYNLKPFNFGVTTGFLSDKKSNTRSEVKEEPEKSEAVEPHKPLKPTLSDVKIEPLLDLAADQVKKEISQTCEALSISPNPSDWSSEHLRSWLLLTVQQFNIPMSLLNLDLWNMDGQAVVNFNEEDFKQRLPYGHGETLFAQFDIWRTNSYYDQSCSQESHSSYVSPPPPYPDYSWTPETSGEAQMSQGDQYSDIAYMLQMLDNQNNPVGHPQTHYIRPKCEPELSSPPPYPGAGASTESVASSDCGQDNKEETEEDEDDEEAEVSQKSPSRPGTNIHLWQFVKELLLQPSLYGNYIHWIDRPKGIFKIVDSVKVATLWGKRKNRPAMNYDKLSRSLRQYYKKGIMKKTERSQRLVYQFCHPYHL